ncbi:uncharacterized protein J8A68_004853 [[Candida] subhashii]|uniref:Uncharacterized protein n=1 Tax=[Candida] subhashii TaxID=561895 RepID=A0A8J5QI72_9ASCO|nr:uncharacterized protein J8A68_004853 [[Candida] subhashii]KAG7661586.1 hypothetical protein J8A68_004853 [[Candida] subhashii]
MASLILILFAFIANCWATQAESDYSYSSKSHYNYSSNSVYSYSSKHNTYTSMSYNNSHSISKTYTETTPTPITVSVTSTFHPQEPTSKVTPLYPMTNKTTTQTESTSTFVTIIPPNNKTNHSTTSFVGKGNGLEIPLALVVVCGVLSAEIARFTLLTDSPTFVLPITLRDGEMHAEDSTTSPQVFSLMDEGSLWAVDPDRLMVESATMRVIEPTDTRAFVNIEVFGIDADGYLTHKGNTRFYRGTSFHLGLDNTILTTEYSTTVACKLKVINLEVPSSSSSSQAESSSSERSSEIECSSSQVESLSSESSSQIESSSSEVESSSSSSEAINSDLSVIHSSSSKSSENSFSSSSSHATSSESIIISLSSISFTSFISENSVSQSHSGSGSTPSVFSSVHHTRSPMYPIGNSSQISHSLVVTVSPNTKFNQSTIDTISFSGLGSRSTALFVIFGILLV